MAQLQFKGKSFVQNHHLLVKYHELLPDKGKSLTDKVSLQDNLIIHGDNLIALKALLPMYASRVKCIYIDPPYNTGNERWVYNDNVNSPMMQEWLGKVVDREDLTRHDKWLCMMMPRLKLLRELLADDGIILVSIDDNESQHLRSLMSEVFSEENFIAQLVWEKGRKNDARFFSVGHEYILVYARSLSRLREKGEVWREAKPGAQELWEQYCDLKRVHGDDYASIEKALARWLRSLPAKHPCRGLSRYRHVDKWGPWRDRDISWPGGGGPRYNVPHPETGEPCKVPERGWVYATPAAMSRQIDLGLIVFREDHSAPPFRKAHLRPVAEEVEDAPLLLDNGGDEDGLDVGLQVMPSVIYKQSQVTIKYFRQIMSQVSLENPKDHEVLARIIGYVCGEDKNALVLDSFAGSGTTAHAVLALNQADGGKRHFILVECEEYADKLTAERVRRVIRGVPDAKDVGLKSGLGGTFSYFDLGAAIDAARLLEGRELPSYMELARYIFYTVTGEEFDEKDVDPSRHFIGASRQHQVFLFYEPDVTKLRSLAFTLDDAKALPRLKEGQRRLVIAPTKYLDQELLDLFLVDFAQLPFEIYEMAR